MLAVTARCTLFDSGDSSRSINDGETMQQIQNSNDGWRTCPSGTLIQLSTRLRKSQQRQAVQRIAGITATLLLILTAGSWYPSQSHVLPDDYPHGGISCMEVRDSLPLILSDKANQKLVSKIRLHLSACPRCAELARRIQQESYAASRPTTNDERISIATMLADTDR